MKSPLVVIPTFNECDNIARLADAVFSLPPRFDILVVDDASPDKTSEIVRKHPQFSSRLHLIERPKKLGLGTAYVRGFQWALENNYSLILQMDADFSHDPKELERLLTAAQAADLALGSRYIKGGGVLGWAKHREILSRAANVYARMFIRVPIHDLTGGFKCYRREVLEAIDLHTILSEGYAFQIETTIRAHRKKFKIVEVPIVFKEREYGKSKISRRVVREALWLVAKLSLT